LLNAVAVNGSAVYAGGQFTTIGGQTRQYYAALDASTGAALGAQVSGNNFVNALAASGSSVYVGGLFDRLGGHDVPGLAAVGALLGVSAVAPAHGGDAGEVTITFHGVGFSGG